MGRVHGREIALTRSCSAHYCQGIDCTLTRYSTYFLAERCARVPEVLQFGRGGHRSEGSASQLWSANSLHAYSGISACAGTVQLYCRRYELVLLARLVSIFVKFKSKVLLSNCNNGNLDITNTLILTRKLNPRYYSR